MCPPPVHRPLPPVVVPLPPVGGAAPPTPLWWWCPRASIYTVRPVLIRKWKPRTAHLTPEPPALIGGRKDKTHNGAVVNLTPPIRRRHAVFIFVPFGGGQS